MRGSIFLGLLLGMLAAARGAAAAPDAAAPSSGDARTQAQSPADFDKAFRAVRRPAAQAFENDEAFDAQESLQRLDELEKGASNEQKDRIAALRDALKGMEDLRAPQAAAAAGTAPTLDAGYALKVGGLARLLNADEAKALESRRQRLAPAGGGAPGAAGRPAAAPTPQELAAARRNDELAAGRQTGVGQRSTANAARIAAALSGTAGPGEGAGAVFAGPSLPRGVDDVSGHDASEFRPAQHLRTSDVPSPDAAPGPKNHVQGLTASEAAAAKKEFLTAPRFEGLKQTYDAYAARKMGDSEARIQEGAALLEQGGVGNTILAGWKSTQAFGDRLLAGDEKTVTQAAVGVAVATAAVVAAPAVVTAFAATTATAAVVAGVTAGAEAGSVALTTYGLLHGTAELVHEPNVANAALLATNLVPIPYIGKFSEAAGQLAGKLTEKTMVTAGKDAEPAAASLASAAVVKQVERGASRVTDTAIDTAAVDPAKERVFKPEDRVELAANRPDPAFPICHGAMQLAYGG